MRIRDTDERHERLRRLMEATGEQTKSKAFDVACAHYLRDLENKQRVADELDEELLEELSTAYLPLERDVEHKIGPTETQ